MLTQRVRKVGNSYVVTIPKEEARRLDLQEGDMVSLEVRKVRLEPEMAPDLQASFERVTEKYAADIEYLKDR